MKLQDVATGKTVRIREIADPETRLQAMRLGIAPGETVTCAARIPAGPTVITRFGMELALGQRLCDTILVEVV